MPMFGLWGEVVGCVVVWHSIEQRGFGVSLNYGPEARAVAAVGNSTGAGCEVDEAYSAPGGLGNSGVLDGLPVEEAKRAVIARAEGEGWGEGSTVYRLRDWGVSRQRYWGTPIPIVHCAACGPVAVPKDQLPVTLPDDVSLDVPGNPPDSSEERRGGKEGFSTWKSRG